MNLGSDIEAEVVTNVVYDFGTEVGWFDVETEAEIEEFCLRLLVQKLVLMYDLS